MCGHNRTFVRARCDCGKEIEVELSRLAQGHKKSCGHLRSENALSLSVVNAKRIDANKLVAGLRFDKLTVIEDLGLQPAYGYTRSLVRVKCDCGKEKTVLRAQLLARKQKSCGCRKAEVMRTIGLQGLNRKAFGIASAHAAYCAYTKKAKQKGLEWALSENDFLTITSQPCFYCGAPPSNVSKSGVYNGDYVYSGIDRMDSEKGYVAGNVVACCFVCNRAKSDMPLVDFLAWIEKFRRPCGDVELDHITDKHGKIVTQDEAVRRGWLVCNNDPVLKPYVDNTRNLFVDQGRQVVAYAFGFRSPISNYTVQRFGVGTGLTPAKVTDVALQAPIVLNTGTTTKLIDAVDFLSPFVVRVAFTLANDDANGYLISEMGLFSGGEALIARKVRAVSINKTADYSPVLSWRLKF